MPLLRRKGLYETGRVIYLHPDVLHPNPNQPRKRFSPDGLEELAASIREHGVLQPLTVRKVDGSFELVSGERRLRAARMAGLSEVPCIVIDVDGVKIGGGNFAVIAGPCSIESEEQITYCAQRVKAAGASLLRGGAFKPRTSPYSFQGMRSEGLDLLKLARRATGAPIVTEIMNTEHLPLFENVDLIQVGARNMQNFELLKAVGRQKKPVLLKRGLANTLEEFVMSAEYIMAEGNENVILCERGIRTFETSMRNTLDLAGVVMLHKMTHLPVIVDPSHACGHAWMVPDLAKAAVAAGADGLMIEVHNNPAKAKCDGAQSLTPDQFDELMQFIGKEVEFFGKKLN